MIEVDRQYSFRVISPPVRGSLETYADSLERFLERRKIWFLLGISLLYFAATCARAYSKLIWYDEFFTYYISGLPHLSDIWYALKAATQNDPPLNYILTRMSMVCFGDGHVAFRAPAIVSFWVMCLCLYAFVAKRYSRTCAFAAFFFPLMTGAWAYACEERPYAIVLACCALSLLSWASAADGHKRTLSLLGLGLSLGIALSSHYFAVILFVPLLAGEIARTFSRRAIDWPIWIAFAVSATPLIAFLPLIHASRQYSTHIWFRADAASIAGTYSFLLASALPYLIFIAAATVLIRLGDSSIDLRSTGLRAHELVAVLFLVALPVIGFEVGVFVTGTFVPRYALAAVVGITILLVMLVSDFGKARALSSGLCFAVFFISFWISGVRSLREFLADPAYELTHLNLQTFNRHGELPIALSNAEMFLKLETYGPPALRPRLFRLTDADAAIRHLDTDTGERNMAGLQRISSLPIVDYRPFIDSHRQFLVFGYFVNRYDWLIQQLRSDGASVELVDISNGTSLFRVTMPKRQLSR